MVKGMPLQSVAKVLVVKFATVQRWLKLRAQESEKIEAMLTKELYVSPGELHVLWTFVKKNSLRQRAIH